MARIRTVKPEFFTSDDICSLTPLARLLYIGLWCEADRDGRMAWTPRAFKRRYLPDDQCDIEALCGEIVKRGLVVLYGDGLAYIPRFLDHQHINPRETPSVLPAPPAKTPKNDASPTRAARVNDAPVTHREEGRKEGNIEDASDTTRQDADADASASKRGTRLPKDWQPSPEEQRWATDACPGIDAQREAEKFRDFWTAKSGKDATKLDWTATWRNWIRNAADRHRPGGFQLRPPAEPISQAQRKRLS